MLDQLDHEFKLPTKISKIAVTCGPGLIGCLGVGLTIAKTLGMLWHIPVYGVNHLRGHAYSPFMRSNDQASRWTDHLPHLGLLVSGGNTLLFEITEDRSITVIGRTKDDAAGEALDKGAKLLGISYPVERNLSKWQRTEIQQLILSHELLNPKKIMTLVFQDLKSSLLYTLQKMSEVEVERNHSDLCASYQEAAMDQLGQKCLRFLEKKRYRKFWLIRRG